MWTPGRKGTGVPGVNQRSVLSNCVVSWSQLAVPAVKTKVSCCSATNQRVKLNSTHVYNKYLSVFVLLFILFGSFEEKWLNVEEDLQVKVWKLDVWNEQLNNWAWSQTLVNFISLCWLENVCITRKIARLKAVKHVWEHGSLIDGSQNGCFLPPAPVVTVELLFKIWQKWTIPATLFWHKQVECLEKHYFTALCKPTEVVLYPHITLCHLICDPACFQRDALLIAW